MQNRTKNFALALGIFTVVTLGLGKLFDTRCGGGCINEAIAANKGNLDISGLEKYHIRIDGDELIVGDSKDVDGNININLAGDNVNYRDDSDNSARIKEPLKETYAGKDLKRIEIKSYTTDWKISEGADDKATFVFTGYLPGKEWAASESSGKLTMELKKKGPREAQLILPKDFQGEIVLTNVSGDLEVEKLAKTEQLTLTNVSGSAKILVAPTKSLNVNTVSGDVEFEPKTVSKDLNIEVHTVNGDINSTLMTSIKSFEVESVNGDFTLKTGKAVGFKFKMAGVNASFDGLPEGSERTDRIAHGQMKGAFGPDPKGRLSFESVNGDFKLEELK